MKKFNILEGTLELLANFCNNGLSSGHLYIAYACIMFSLFVPSELLDCSGVTVTVFIPNHYALVHADPNHYCQNSLILHIFQCAEQ